MPMPVDLVVTFIDGTQQTIYLPLTMMRGGKPDEPGMPQRVTTEVWPWTNPTKSILLKRPMSEIKSVEIDPSRRMADTNLENNKRVF
jgi:hypothetical protein